MTATLAHTPKAHVRDAPRSTLLASAGIAWIALAWMNRRAAIVIVAVLAASVAALQLELVRRGIARWARRIARNRRERARLMQVRRSGAFHQRQYLQLRALVGYDANAVTRFELEDLLDRFALLAANHQCCTDALARAIACDRSGPIATSVPKPSGEIRARRVLHRKQCLARADRIADELDAIDELVRLVIERAAYASLGEHDLEIELDRRLAELDELDKVDPAAAQSSPLAAHDALADPHPVGPP